MRRRTVALISILLIVVITAGILRYTAPQTRAQACVRPSNGFLIIANDKGYNDSVDQLSFHHQWPVITVQQGQTVDIVVCNTDIQAHGFQISHYLDSTINVIRAGQNQAFSFAANQAGTFQIFNSVFDTTDVFERSGQLTVQA